MLDLQGLHHIALKTANFAALRSFYTETLGLPVVGGFPGYNIIFLGGGSTTIELIEADAPTEPLGQGLNHLAFTVADVDATTEALIAKGVAFHKMPRDFPAAAPTVRIAFFKDPDGNELELVQALF